MSIEQTPISTAQHIISTQQQIQTQTQTIPTQVQTQQQQVDQKLLEKINNIIASMLQTANDLAYEIATLEDEKCSKCPIVAKCRTLVKLLKELIKLQREFRR